MFDGVFDVFATVLTFFYDARPELRDRHRPADARS